MAQLLRATATTRSTPRPPSSPTPPPTPRQTPVLSAIARRVAKVTISTALSLNLLLLSPLPTPAQPQPLPLPLPPPMQEEYCREDVGAGGGGVSGEEASQPGEFTNESIVEEAWSIVNESYLGAGRRPWSPDTWQRKKEDILSGKIQTRAKAHEIIRRMLSGLGDPYTRFLPPNEFSKMARYDMSGIGINLREVLDNEGKLKLKVMGLLLDGPAHSVGVRQGDEILTVNGNDVRGKSAFEVSSLLQGPTGTLVTIEVRHGNCGPIQSLEVQRMLVARTPVFYRMEQLGSGSTSVGYIRLKEFNALARKDFVTAMKRLHDMGASSFILDLRDNLGGLVQAGIEIAKLFLNQGDTDVVFMNLSPQYIAIWGGLSLECLEVQALFFPDTASYLKLLSSVIYTVGRDSQYQNTITTDAAPLITDPVIVLVNSKTASASEIVASALHDNCKAVLVGEKTFGKGLIQSVFELDDGSGLAVTVGKYVTPNHKDINGNGIEPDFRNLPAWNEVGKHISECKRQRQG